jgi:transposase InsO family protein
MGIRDKPIAPGSPWQNGYAERLIGSIRRECTDHVVAFGAEHLRRVLQSYARYYNMWRTHRALDKDAPRSSGDRAPWRHHVTTHTGWTSPSILQNLVFGTHSGSD